MPSIQHCSRRPRRGGADRRGPTGSLRPVCVVLLPSLESRREGCVSQGRAWGGGIESKAARSKGSDDSKDLPGLWLATHQLRRSYRMGLLLSARRGICTPIWINSRREIRINYVRVLPIKGQRHGKSEQDKQRHLQPISHAKISHCTDVVTERPASKSRQVG